MVGFGRRYSEIGTFIKKFLMMCTQPEFSDVLYRQIRGNPLYNVLAGIQLYICILYHCARANYLSVDLVQF